MNLNLFPALLFASTLRAAEPAASTFPPPKTLGDVSSYGRNIQRTMRLLATSTAEKRNSVRVLFYGHRQRTPIAALRIYRPPLK